MLPQNVEKEMHLCRAQYLRFFRVRQDRVGKQERPAEGAAPPPKGQREALDAAFSKSLRLLLDPERQLMQKLVNRRRWKNVSTSWTNWSTRTRALRRWATSNGRWG